MQLVDWSGVTGSTCHDIMFLSVFLQNCIFAQEIEAALNETVDTERILKLETSPSDSSDCTGLHELIVAVQEANQRCKELGINFVS